MPFKLVKKFQDQQLIRRLKNRDREAFIRVYDENVKEIYRFIYFKIGRRDEADDVTSLVFLKTWHHIQNKTLEDAGTLRALLYKVARNVVIDYYRDKANQAVTSLNDEKNPLEVIDDSVDLPADMDRDRELSLIRRELPNLKDEYREVIIMRFVNDLSIEEIAAVSGKSKGNVRVLLHRALSALKDLIEAKSAAAVQSKTRRSAKNNILAKNK